MGDRYRCVSHNSLLQDDAVVRPREAPGGASRGRFVSTEMNDAALTRGQVGQWSSASTGVLVGCGFALVRGRDHAMASRIDPQRERPDVKSSARLVVNLSA